MNPTLAQRLIIIGLLLTLMGFVLPFLIILGVLKSTFLLNFLAFTVSVGGLFLGIIGVSMYVSKYRKRDE